MERVLDVRGLSCPIPLIKARAATEAMAPGDVLVVLATDPEAPIDLAAMAADHGHRLETAREQDHWRLTLMLGSAARPRRTHAAEPGEPDSPTS